MLTIGTTRALLPPLLHHMNELTELAITAILKDLWHPQVYYPPFTDVEKWIGSIELLCEQYGIPDVQRVRCAVMFVKKGLRQALEKVLKEFGVVRWDRFKALLREFDGERSIVLPIQPPLTWILQGTTERSGSVRVPFITRWYLSIYDYANPSQQSSRSG